MVVSVGNTPVFGNFLTSGYIQCGTYSGAVGLSSVAEIVCTKPIEGSHVAVQIMGTNEQLTVCEVFVYPVLLGWFM